MSAAIGKPAVMCLLPPPLILPTDLFDYLINYLYAKFQIIIWQLWLQMEKKIANTLETGPMK